MMNINASQTFNNTISHFFTNLGSYSLIKDITPDSYSQLNKQINNISHRIKNGKINTDNLDELNNELTEIKIANDNVKYIIEENNTPTNITFGLEIQKVLLQLFDLLISYHMENNINKNEYETRISHIHNTLLEQEQYFNNHIFKDDPDHQQHVKHVLANIDKQSTISMTESEFLGELDRW